MKPGGSASRHTIIPSALQRTQVSGQDRHQEQCIVRLGSIEELLVQGHGDAVVGSKAGTQLVNESAYSYISTCVFPATHR